MKKPTRRNNHIVFDMNKVAYAWFFWRNQHNETMRLRPERHSVHCERIDSTTFAWPYLQEYPKETSLERARRLECLDRWIPVVKLRMSAADVLEFTGDKARSIWREWNKRQFKTKQNEHTNTTKPKRNQVPKRQWTARAS